MNILFGLTLGVSLFGCSRPNPTVASADVEALQQVLTQIEKQIAAPAFVNSLSVITAKQSLTAYQEVFHSAASLQSREQGGRGFTASLSAFASRYGTLSALFRTTGAAAAPITIADLELASRAGASLLTSSGMLPADTALSTEQDARILYISLLANLAFPTEASALALTAPAAPPASTVNYEQNWAITRLQIGADYAVIALSASGQINVDCYSGFTAGPAKVSGSNVSCATPDGTITARATAGSPGHPAAGSIDADLPDSSSSTGYSEYEYSAAPAPPPVQETPPTGSGQYNPNKSVNP